MNEIRRDEIIYEDGWRDAAPAEAEPQTAEPPQETPAAKEKAESGSRPLLTILQLILCLLAALVLFLLKAMDSGAYHDFMEFYSAEMSKPVVSQSVFETVDWNALFGGEPVQIAASPDEIPRR